MALGAGRENKEDKIDYNAGVVLRKNINDYVNKDEVILDLYTNKEIKPDIKIEISKEETKDIKLIYEIIN